MDTWATIEQPAIVKISTSCSCVKCVVCEVFNTDVDTCEECGEAMVPTDNCMDECWEYKKEDLKETIFPEFLARNNEPTSLRIEGKSMGWQSRSGYKEIDATFNELWSSLTLNGDWTLVFTLAGTSFTVFRYSHDEPTGASFSIYGVSVLEYAS